MGSSAVICHLIFGKNVMRYKLQLFSFYRWGNRDTKILTHLLKFQQLISIKARLSSGILALVTNLFLNMNITIYDLKILTVLDAGGLRAGCQPDQFLGGLSPQLAGSTFSLISQRAFLLCAHMIFCSGMFSFPFSLFLCIYCRFLFSGYYEAYTTHLIVIAVYFKLITLHTKTVLFYSSLILCFWWYNLQLFILCIH